MLGMPRAEHMSSSPQHMGRLFEICAYKRQRYTSMGVFVYSCWLLVTQSAAFSFLTSGHHSCFPFQRRSPLASFAQDAVEEAAPDFAGTLNVFYITSRSIDDALEESITGEIMLFVATCESVLLASRSFQLSLEYLVLVGDWFLGACCHAW